VERGYCLNRSGVIRHAVLGKTLLDMAKDDYADPATAQQSKQLMRMLLNHQLGGKTLHTRELINDLQKL